MSQSKPFQSGNKLTPDPRDARIAELEKFSRINADEMAQARERIRELDAVLAERTRERGEVKLNG